MKGKKIFLSLILIISFIFAIQFKANASTSTAIAGKVNTDGANLNVRQSTSTSSSILAKVADNTYLTIIRSSGNWYYVEYKENNFGYVHKDYVNQVSNNTKQVSTGGVNLNARTGPGTYYEIFDKIIDKDYVIVLSSANGWARVLFEGHKIGYVSMDYLKGSNTYPSLSLNVVSYKQYDSRWAYHTIGSSGRTFKEIGCLTTGMAMVESYRRNATITPLYMESISSYTSIGALYWPSRYSFVTSKSTYLSELYQLLKQGKPVLVGSKNSSGGQHWVVVYGYNGSNTLTAANFLIRDPGSSTRTNLQQFFNSYPNFYKLAYYTY